MQDDLTSGRSAEAALADSEARLALATSAAGLGIWDWDLATNSFIYSARAREICGFPTTGDVTYTMVQAVTHPDDYPHTSAQAARAVDPAVKSKDPYEYRLVRRDGEVRWVLAHGEAQFASRDGVEQATRYVGTLQDITERRRLSEKHHALGQRLQLALHSSRMAVWEVDLVTDVLIGSPELYRLFGLPEDGDHDAACLRALYYPGERERMAEIGRAVLDRGERYIELDFRIVRPDGEGRWLALRCELLWSEDGQPTRAFGVLSDVTARKSRELRQTVLVELTSRTRDLDDPDDVSFVSAEVLGSALGVSRAGYGTIDIEAETITIARDWTAPGIATLAGVLHFRDYGSYIDDLKRGVTVMFADAETDPRTADTAEALKAISARAVVNMPVTEQGGFVAMLYLNNDTARQWTSDELALIAEVANHTRTLVERRRAQRDLRALTIELEQRVAAALAERSLLAEIVENTDAFVQVVDLEFRWMAINRSAASEFERLFGVRPRVGANMLELLDGVPNERRAVEAAWRRALGGEAYTDIQEFGELDRRFYELKFDILRNRAGEQIGAFQFVYDVTDRLKAERRLADAEEALRQAQKMEAMGQLTGGVAHDFNNLLTPILGGLDILQRRIGSDERNQRILRGALASAERAQTLVQRLLAFARRQPLQPSAIDVAQLINGMRDLIASTTGPQVRVGVRVDDNLPRAHADANQLEMALLNLAVNARDAMPDGGELRIAALAVEVTEQDPTEMKSGHYVRIVVEDTGLGMDEATLRKATEPFFSTKGIGQGTGLGLSMVHGLAAQLGGALQIESKPGSGTSVALLLPVSTLGEYISIPPTSTSAELRAGTVLLVDDEEFVRASTAEMLKELGCTVIETWSADEALRLVVSGLPVDFVITDHLMPGMTGSELACILRRDMPNLPVLVISGYANMDGIPVEIARLTKPFRQMDLARSLKALACGS